MHITLSSSLAAYGKGFMTMAALIVAIGVQNSFLLRQGLKHRSVFLAAAVCTLCDYILIGIGTAGIGAILMASPRLSMIVAFAGAVFLLYYGVRSLLAAKHAKGIDLSAADKVSRASIAATAFAVSMLNPHAIMDTVVIVGGLTTRYEGALRVICAIGAASASTIWFFGLAYGARKLAPILTKPKIWRLIDLLIGVMMLSIAFSLARDGWQLLVNR